MNTETVYTAIATAFSTHGYIAAPFMRNDRPEPSPNLFISAPDLVQERAECDVYRARMDVQVDGAELDAQTILDILDPLMQDDISGTAESSGDIAILTSPSIDNLSVQVDPDTSEVHTAFTLSFFTR